MQTKINKLFNDLNEQLNFINLEIDNQCVRCESAINIILKTIQTLKIIINENNFKSKNEEIQFFKEIKPQFTSKLIYYNALYKIEMKTPFGGHDVVKNYLNNELLRLKIFFDNNLDFYKYYRTKSTYLDYKYFLRGEYDIKLSLDTYYFETDHSFSTSHDYKIAKIIANDLIQIYIEDKVANPSLELKAIKLNKLNWTGSKTALIELIYALHSQAVIENGNNDIKLLVKFFENTFNIELGDIYHTYMELRNRKINRTKFLDALKESLLRKMDEQDEK